MRVLVCVQYSGKDFSGFQKQPGRRTVAGEMERALAELFKSETRVYGCARTDAGAHAICHPVAFDVPDKFDAGRLKGALNAHLPEDIRVLEARKVRSGFLPLEEAVARTYVYLLSRDEKNPVFLKDYSFHPGILLSDEAHQRLEELAKLFEGTHDFGGFLKSGSSAKTTVRTLFDATVRRSKSLTALVFTGSGFLYGQVRNIVGALIEVLKGRLEPEEIKDCLGSGRKPRILKPAPPQGLFLYRVWFKNKDLNFHSEFPFMDLNLTLEDKIYHAKKQGTADAAKNDVDI